MLILTRFIRLRNSNVEFARTQPLLRAFYDDTFGRTLVRNPTNATPVTTVALMLACSRGIKGRILVRVRYFMLHDFKIEMLISNLTSSSNH